MDWNDSYLAPVSLLSDFYRREADQNDSNWDPSCHVLGTGGDSVVPPKHEPTAGAATDKCLVCIFLNMLKPTSSKPGCCFLSLSDIPGRIHGSEFSQSRNKKRSETHGKCSEHGIQAAQLFMLSHCSQSAAVHLFCGRHRYRTKVIQSCHPERSSPGTFSNRLGINGLRENPGETICR